jgi:(1->4)-alpha-D-glucan 1-alpha-D-glucosylmutase
MKARHHVPRATYRLQFNGDFTLRQARELVPYLDELGVSHIYASPLLKARPGSTHGYDLCDPTQINPDLGTEADLEDLVAALHARDMGLILDIVPNHMGIGGPENSWWWDVLKHGRASRFAECFDIDWDVPDPHLRGKVLLPVLGDDLARVLERGELQLQCDCPDPTIRYSHQRFPLSPASSLNLGAGALTAAVGVQPNTAALADLLDQQHYRLAPWREGDRHINYRRFFTVTHLAGVRVEVPQVFADTHNRILDWCQRGWLDGLRVDHPDGLRDPGGYLRRLHRAAPKVWIVVEKILARHEAPPAGWPVAGTTGYDFLNHVNALFVDPAGAKPLTDFYLEFAGVRTDYADLEREKKRWILEHRLQAEVDRLVRLLAVIGTQRAATDGASPEQLRAALVELIACFPVYRTYVRPRTRVLSPADKAHIRAAAVQAGRALGPRLAETVAFLRALLQRDLTGPLESEFVTRFQQLTGPAMAKGVEDTAFYCYNRFVALNEVGGDPNRFGLSVAEFHEACGQTRAHWPATMRTTSTHDTKRGEDVRARLALLSEIPQRWSDAVRRWSAFTANHHRDGWPDRNAEYFFYQTLVGAWPLSPDRAVAHMEKAVREAKEHTNWRDPNPAYEGALKDFVMGVLRDTAFVPDVARFVEPLIRPGYVNALAQTLLKLTAPGVPDVYQGSELWDLSLVDPDNRRPVDFAHRRALLAELARPQADGAVTGLPDALLQNPGDGRLKMYLINQTLRHRRLQPGLYRRGDYVPLWATGRQADHVCAFARRSGRATAITVVPRLVLGLTVGEAQMPIGAAVWQDTQLLLPRAQADRPFHNVFTGELVYAPHQNTNAVLRLADVLRRFPVALLEKRDFSNRSTRANRRAPRPPP